MQLSTLANSYCYVEQPFSEGSLVAGQCGVSLPRATRAVQGTWNVFLGIPGRVQEIHVQRQVNVACEYEINWHRSAMYNVCLSMYVFVNFIKICVVIWYIYMNEYFLEMDIIQTNMFSSFTLTRTHTYNVF